MFSKFKPGLHQTVHHFNRIHCVKFNPEDERIIYSGGADRNLTIHDTRCREPLRNLIGPYVLGDAIDVRGTHLLAGSYRSEECLEIYDIRKYEKLHTIDWDSENPAKGGIVVAAKFGYGGQNNIIAAGKSYNDVKVFDWKEGTVKACAHGFDEMIYSIDASNSSTQSEISVGMADGIINCLKFED